MYYIVIESNAVSVWLHVMHLSSKSARELHHILLPMWSSFQYKATNFVLIVIISSKEKRSMSNKELFYAVGDIWIKDWYTVFVKFKSDTSLF